MIIDELADLMQTAPPMESAIARITQTRAGFTLSATQTLGRADVTPRSKQHPMPDRVSSREQDHSRVIPMKMGPIVCWPGDMLYLPPGTSRLIRTRRARDRRGNCRLVEF